MVIADPVIDPGVGQWGDPAAGGNGSELAEGLLSLLNASRSQVQAILEQSVLDGIVLPDEVYSVYSLAEEVASEVLLLMVGGIYEEAVVKATEALQLYEDVLMMVLDSNYPALFVSEEGSTDLNELWATLERGYAYLQEVNDTASKLAKAGVNVSHVNDLLNMAEDFLVHTEELLLLEEAEEAEGELESVFKVLDGSMTLMQSLNEGLTTEKTAGFLDNSKRRLERLEAEILNLIDPLSLEPEVFDALLQSLEDAHLKNRALKDLLEDGNMSSVLSGFENFQQYEGDVFDILEIGDTDVAKYLKKAYKVEVRISHHEEVGDPKGLDATIGEPEPEADEDSKGADSKGKPDKTDKSGKGGKNKGGGLKKGHSNESHENE